MSCFSGSSTKSTSTSESKTEAQKKWLAEALELYGPELGKGADIYPESRVTPLSTLQTQAITGAGQFADYFSEPQTVGTPLFEETGTAIKDILAGETGAKPLGAQDVEDYFKGAVYEPTMKTFKEDTIPGIAESFAGPGFWGSGRSQEQAKAYEDVSADLASKRTALEWDVLQQNQALEEAKAGRTVTALPTAMAYGQVPAQQIMNNLNIAAQQIGGLNQIFGFGQAEQTQAQAQLQDEITRFAEENQITDPENMQILLTLLGLNFSTSSSSSTGTGPGLGYAGLTSFLGGFGGGLGGGMATPG